MRDITLEDTFYHQFTTRAFATGIPTVLAGTPVLSVLEENNATPITAGVSVSVDRASVVGLNEATIVATAANGYDSGKSYAIYISTGTVGGVSVVGEVVGQFTIAASAAAVDLANGTDGLGAIKTDTAAILADTADIQPNYATSAELAKVPKSDGTSSWNATALGAINAEVDTALTDIHLDHLMAAAAADVVVDGSVIAHMVSATEDWSTFVPSTDSLQAMRDRGDAAWTTGAGGSDRLLMVDTTIATLSSQTSFTLTAGSADDDAYNNCTIVIEDVSTATQKAVGLISDYTGASKTVTLKYDPAIFTMATTDKVYILAENALKSTAANRQLDVTATGAAGIDWANIENPTTAVDLSGTDIQLVDTVTTYTGNTVQTGDVATLITTVGTAGDGLTNINLPNQTMDIVGDITGNLSGSVGSVTGAVGSVTGAVGSVTGAVGSVAGNVDGSTASVTGAVGSVTGAVGSVTAEVTADMVKISGSTVAADNLEESTEAIITGSSVTGTLSTTVSTTDITGYVDDELIGRTIIWKSGTANGQASDITDYASASGTVTYTAITTAPANGDLFVIV